MAQSEWTQMFQNKTSYLGQGDSWRLEFDENIEPESPNQGWKEYIRKTCARRSWPSNRVMVVFHMLLNYGQGTVKVRLFRQNCKRCTAAPMERPSVTTENIDILLEKLVEKIRIKCYNEKLGTNQRRFRTVDVKSPHEPSHCEACIKGICTRNSANVGF
ncbi:receptor-transporting protein 2 isoform X2 [Anabas testudineus]|uniref:3CxxC-type domain-containing protein n=1 Tax=Anabas testudineus TaxID=64144 RepID=A0AAQ6IK22_ANATE|nr:receptor-transporting protein 2 isoform X2 [Anabas testudineus]